MESYNQGGELLDTLLLSLNIYRCRSLCSVSSQTPTGCVYVCVFYIKPSREPQPQGKISRPTQSGVYANPPDQAHIPTHTHQPGSLNTFFFNQLCSQSCMWTQTSSHMQERQLIEIKQTHTKSLFSSEEHIHTHTPSYMTGGHLLGLELQGWE